jgi:hypothetical protein
MKQLISCIIFIFVSLGAPCQIRDKGNFTQPRNQADIIVTAVKFENYISPNGPATIQFPTYQIDRPTSVDSPNVKCSITVHNR